MAENNPNAVPPDAAPDLQPCNPPREAELLALVSNAPDGIFLADIDGRYTFVNEAGGRLLRYACEELCGKTIFDLVRDEDVPRLLASKERMLRGETDVGEWELRTGDGTWVPVEVHACIHSGGQWLGFVRDISARKAREAERTALNDRLEAESRWLQAVLDTVPLGVLLFRPAGQWYFNRRFEELLGMQLSPGAQSPQYVDRIHLPDGTPIAPEDLLSAQVLGDGKTVIGVERLWHRPDGSQVPVLASAGPVRDPKGGIIGGVGVFQDISDRMRMERTIRTNEQLLTTIFDLLPVGVWIADGNGCITRNNPAAEKIWRGVRYIGISEFAQYKGWRLDTGKPIGADEWALARALTKGETSPQEMIRIQCFDGSFKTIVNFAAPLRDENGAVSGAIVVNEDITALYQTQEQLRAAVRDRENILAVVAHDLRNALAGIVLSAGAAALKAQGVRGGEAVHDLALTTLRNANRLSDLVDDLLAVSVLEAGRSALALAPVPGSELATAAYRAAQPQFEAAGVRLDVQCLEPVPIVRVDRTRILRVFTNLLDNALKYTASGGQVVLRTEPVSGGVRYCIANSGDPLPDAELREMFKPFWQAARTNRRGVGLGLSICRSIVEAHGGSIWAEPAEGQRIRVCFLLPKSAGSGPP